MSKAAYFVVAGCVFLLCAHSLVFASDESITLTTYYPSPVGVYKQLRLAPQGAALPAPCQEGSLYYDTTAVPHSLKVCGSSLTWQSMGAGYWTANGNDIYNTNTGRVGIGTNSPTYKLDVNSMGGRWGIRGSAVVPGGMGVTGESDNSAGVYGSAINGYGVLGQTSGAGMGVYGLSDSGRGVLGLSNTYIGVEGICSGYSYGVHGQSTNGAGIFGESGSSNGVTASATVGHYCFYANGPGTKYGPFSGGHDVILAGDFPRDVKRGSIVSVTGEAKTRKDKDGSVLISSTLPTVKLSDKANDKAVIGVFASETALAADHWYKAQSVERFAIVNALGEGRALVTDMNGPVRAGDYITTSAIAGYGQKQDDDLVHSYTLGKATENVEWDKVKETVVYNGQKYKAYLIAVVYTSG
jgi:hypothetical protein